MNLKKSSLYLVILSLVLTRKLVSHMYYLGEVEEELRDIGLEKLPFKDTDLDPVMDLIEEKRQTSLYKHECSPTCKVKGIVISLVE